MDLSLDPVRCVLNLISLVKVRSRHLLLFALLPGLTGVMGWGQASRSPFLPPSVEAVEEVAEVTEDAELQFCGVFGDGNNKRFLIYNATTRRSSWLRLNEEGPDELYVDAYDAEQGTVAIRQGGRSLNLGLQAARVTGGSGGGAAPVVLTGTTKDLTNTVKVNPSPADERRRLEAVAAEVRRRRAARAAAAAGNPASTN